MKKFVVITMFGMGLAVIAPASTGLFPGTPGLPGNKSILLADQDQKKETVVKTIYTCPMHSEVVQDKSGKCPKCGMNLTAREARKDVYTCPMHSEVTQEKTGKCPKCGMNLIAREAGKDSYTCPMHSEVAQDKPGKCPKCGMKLAMKEQAK